MLRRLRLLSWRERWMIAQAAAMLAVVRIALRLLPFRVIARALGLRSGVPAGTADAVDAPRAAVIGAGVRRAANNLPWESTCLVQALAATILLRLSGLDGTLYLGATKDGGVRSSFSAHAWLCCGEVVVTGEAERRRHTAIASFARRSRPAEVGSR
jgi:Transglutaminase-like superfamily